ncbi:hypothetical protein BDZ45DRAFT_747980 [Acephala macrosclerotiorum]|nr:hypothetical protein BDZ45DRAFT_747980 [Acephala macrosclerotiorum]
MPMKDVVKWVLEHCGDHLEEATGSMKIAGIPDSFAQLIVTKPNATLHNAFAAKKSNSRLMFHGTPLSNLEYILKDGFNTKEVWAANEPITSLRYALKGNAPLAGRFAGMQRPRGGKTPYVKYGALLGCEFAERAEASCALGMFQRKYGEYKGHATFTKDAHAIIVRYVFLIPPATATNSNPFWSNKQDSLGFVRLDIEGQMMENISKLKGRIDGNSKAGKGEGSAKGK